MKQSTLSIRMDEDVKKRFDAFCADVGMNATVAVNMFARAVLREKRIPFEIAESGTRPANWFESVVGIMPPTERNADELIAEGRWHDYENLD